MHVFVFQRDAIVKMVKKKYYFFFYILFFRYFVHAKITNKDTSITIRHLLLIKIRNARPVYKSTREGITDGTRNFGRTGGTFASK